MKLLRLIFAGLFGICCISTNAFAVNPQCSEYKSDCDKFIACALASDADDAANGSTPDYTTTVVAAIQENELCKSYPESFTANLDVTVSENPPIHITVNWDNVKTALTNTDNGDEQRDNSDQAIIEAIVNVLGPDTQAQKQFFTALATDYIKKHKNDNELLTDGFVLEFMSDSTNFDNYRRVLTGLTGEAFDEELGIMIDWDNVLIEISNTLDLTHKKRGAVVCENNRSIQASVEIFSWATTAIAAVATFYAGGAGGAAALAGRAALGRALKAGAKAAAKVGAKKFAAKASKQGGKKLEKAAIKYGIRKGAVKDFAKFQGKGTVRAATKHFAKKAGENMRKKKLLVFGALASQVTVHSLKGNQDGKVAKTAYSYVESDASTEILNCQDLDHNEGCYSVCGDTDVGDDMLNKQVLKPIFGKNYCVDPSNYVLVDAQTKQPLVFDASKSDTIKTTIKNKIQDKYPCDRNEDDIDFYIGMFLHDPDTLEPNTDDIIIDDVIRIDD